MDKPRFKDLLIQSLDKNSDPAEISGKIEESGASFSFSEGFQQKVINKVFNEGAAVVREVEFIKNLNYVFYRIALPGVAAILLLLISIYLMEGSFSINSILGLGDNYDESIIYMLTGI